MIEQEALVTRYVNDRATIQVQSAGKCGGCRQQAHCGTATLAKGLPPREFELDCSILVTPGDQVRVIIDDSGLLLASLLAYLLPIAVMLGLVVTSRILWPELVDYLPLLALAGLGVGCWFSSLWQNKHRLQPRFRPRIVDKC